jgi:universal stress protein family protein
VGANSALPPALHLPDCPLIVVDARGGRRVVGPSDISNECRLVACGAIGQSIALARAVLVPRPEALMWTIRHILVPTDLSDAAALAIDRAFDLAKKHDAAVTVLNASDAGLRGYYPEGFEADRRTIEKLAGSVTETVVRSATVPVLTVRATEKKTTALFCETRLTSCSARRRPGARATFPRLGRSIPWQPAFDVYQTALLVPIVSSRTNGDEAWTASVSGSSSAAWSC